MGYQYNILAYILLGCIWFLNVLSWAIIINAILSWLMDPTHPIRLLLIRFIDPIVAPFRQITDKLNTSGMPIDFSPLLAYITIRIVIGLLQSLFVRML